ncbi:hypothetical protein HUU40_05785 [candidate division KSB1 bacterium]|nr:hypothetical protein [candidate division KSB1 bacterium]
MTIRMKLPLNAYWAFFLSFALTILAIELGIVSSIYFAQNPDVFSLALTLDFVLGIPALYYFLLVRKKQAPAITLIPIIILSLIIAGFVLPSSQQIYLDWLKKLIPVLELIVLGFVFSKIRKIAHHFHEAKRNEIYVTDALTASVKQALGNVPGLGFILTEFSLLYFAFAGWFKKFSSSDPGHLPFSYHRRSGYAAIAGVVLLVLITETTALHLLLQRWSALAAWIFTGLSIYSAFWLLGDYHAMRLHPIVLTREFLYLRIGLRWRAVIPLAEIIDIQNFSPREKKAADYLSLTVFGDPRFVIHCKQQVMMLGLFGIKREVRQIGLSVDDEKLFREELRKRLAMPATI